MKTEKKFKAVKMMREIRDKLSKEFMTMSYEEQRRYVTERVRVRPKATQPVKRVDTSWVSDRTRRDMMAEIARIAHIDALADDMDAVTYQVGPKVVYLSTARAASGTRRDDIGFLESKRQDILQAPEDKLAYILTSDGWRRQPDLPGFLD